jgi:hypothetical protein
MTLIYSSSETMVWLTRINTTYMYAVDNDAVDSKKAK